MEYTVLGRTGLRVGVAGLGCGGSSQLGLGAGKDLAHAVSIIRRALDLGVNYFDTARLYRTEAVLGAALKDVPRDAMVISTKHAVQSGGHMYSGDEVVAALHASLKALDTDHVDVFQLHGVAPAAYDHAVDEIVPALLREREKGSFRFLGISETSPHDHHQTMLRRAVDDEFWDVMMLGINMMAQNARTEVLPFTQENNIGTQAMFVVRALFSASDRLKRQLAELAAAGDVPAWLAEEDTPLGLLIHEGGAADIVDAAYRFVRHEPGIDVVLFGTGDPDHLARNIASINAPPLPAADVEKLHALFGHLKGIGLELPRSTAR